MSSINSETIKKLRESTGAGMMDCKTALDAEGGDIEKAKDFLRKKGLAKAAKKADRIAAEGLIGLINNGKTATIVEVNSETDFVSKNEDFQRYVADVALQAIASTSTDIEAFMTEAWNQEESKTVKEVLIEKISIIGENLNIRRFEKVVATEGCVVSYTHGGGRIGVIIEAKTDIVNDSVKECLTNIAMQVAALSPKYISSADVSEEYKDHEREILLAQATLENSQLPEAKQKPAPIIEKMIIGRLNKELKEVCLLEQKYVKDGDFTVAKYMEHIAKENGGSISIKQFIRYETGEGIEKKTEDFAAEVAAQMAK